VNGRRSHSCAWLPVWSLLCRRARWYWWRCMLWSEHSHGQAARAHCCSLQLLVLRHTAQPPCVRVPALAATWDSPVRTPKTACAHPSTTPRLSAWPVCARMSCRHACLVLRVLVACRHMGSRRCWGPSPFEQHRRRGLPLLCENCHGRVCTCFCALDQSVSCVCAVCAVRAAPSQLVLGVADVVLWLPVTVLIAALRIVTTPAEGAAGNGSPAHDASAHNAPVPSAGGWSNTHACGASGTPAVQDARVVSAGACAFCCCSHHNTTTPQHQFIRPSFQICKIKITAASALLCCEPPQHQGGTMSVH
jgi:hypothetical protein